MKNCSKLFGIIIFVAVIGFSLAGCGGSGLNGTWENEGGRTTYIFKGSDYEERYQGSPATKGRFTLDKEKTGITFTITHLYDSSKNAWIPGSGRASDTFGIKISGNSFELVTGMQGYNTYRKK